MRATIALLALSLAACGFQLRGTASLPFETLYLPNATGGMALDLKRNSHECRKLRETREKKEIPSFP